MDIEIKQKRPITFGIKVAVAVILASVILGGLLRITDKSSPSSDGVDVSNSEIGDVYSNTFVPVITLPVNRGSNEKEWTDALANKTQGQSEVQVDRGRVDVMTDYYAIEIDFIKKWHEGLGQAIHYGDESNRIGVLALIDETNGHEQDLQHLELIKKIERLCVEKEIKLIILRPVE
ncbi:MAG: hypothetical protein CMI02_10305 [Oceanospirillaceae bacterium]|nr:hypothetical protein [Alcaligenaceae bacterium]MBT12414.1 hypothetical protein [Oceanospirillaceae bacterium]|tara:strand:+ start:2257 stop:2784 length:528 start_codon:yes stop_codon:yes gene_type:complete